MTIAQINPVVRFAREITITEARHTTVSYDARLFYICSGACRLTVGGTEHTLREGALLLWKGGTPYRFSTNRPIKLISLNFDFTQAHRQTGTLIPVKESEFLSSRVLEDVTFSDFDVLNAPIVLNARPQAVPKLERLKDEFSRRKPGFEALCSAWLKELIVEAAREAQFSTMHGGDKCEAVLRYIEENFNRPLSNEELAEQAGYHVYHLNRLMKSGLGVTLHRYVTNLRIEKAKEYLLATSLSIAEIAEKCGFRTPYYFANVFRAECGTTPSAFRRIHRNRL